MNYTSTISEDLKGRIRYVTKDMNGKILGEYTQHNMIVKGIRPVIVQMLAGSGYTTPLPSIDRISFGDSGVAPTVLDIGLKGETLVDKTIIGAAALSDSNRKATFSVLKSGFFRYNNFF